MRVCVKCEKEQNIDQFRHYNNKAKSIASACKTCDNERLREYRKNTGNSITKKYEKTKNGFIMRLYRNMKSRITGVQKAKFYLYEGKELMSKEEFYKFMSESEDFHFLFAKYEESLYQRRLAPSVDRIDSDLGYTKDNIRIVPMYVNSGNTKQR